MADVLVIGAGPAGLAAAAAAREAGGEVTLLDSSDVLGGQYWRHLPDSRPAERERLLHHGWDTFTALRRRLESDPHVRIVTSAQVWAIERDTGVPAVVHVLVGPPDAGGRQRLALRPDAVVFATGAHDRTLPFPGWDLPGVFTGGAAQALAKGERIAVGRRVLVAGAGPFLLPVAASLTQTGATVVGVLEANRLSTLVKGWAPRPWQLASTHAKARELAGYVANHVRHAIPYRTGRAVVAAHGTDRVTSVTTAAVDAAWTPIAGTERTVEVDAVCVSHGFTPRLELAIAAGCALTPDRFVMTGPDQQTNVVGLYAAGEITGIGGVDLAMAEGSIAGWAAAGGPPDDKAVRDGRRRRAAYRAFAARLEAAHGIRPGWTGWLDSHTIVCRCEEVSFGRLCGAADATSTTSLRSLKLSSRAALGICQGRMCGRSVEEILAGRVAGGRLRDEVVADQRPIAVPIRLGDLAARRDPEPPTASPSQSPTPNETE
ncbi:MULTISPECIES: NAD(P)/FAD-dependent oxidoreductase [unclassified Nocardioides]|uniref:NAD(P)/FAD-dependent oxidoreductase n=1 Tax=unclassified Nocardioides TaxID=2615069 RepID=UPI0009F068F4|nr:MULTISPECIES: NAD(P)/FAD-dependent oxidoreductase [unclassified Nocardioides]GAW50244.1 FAD-dependent pyridine nucleotide-disulfide oxidoreductase [Nocardioides sp. PD653-B2]GAW52966.1 FAD-dependent pyridine nucleotide-disulfide oxidoreductase [Nocardioides sp. PD653]